jgi:cell division protein FtsL
MSPNRFLISKRVGNEQLVRQVDRKRHRELLMLAITCLVLAAAVLAYAWQHFEMIRIGYQMEELRIERERLLKIQRQLSLERASLTSPDRIESIATRQLGMTMPSVSQIVVMEVYGGLEEARYPDFPGEGREPSPGGVRSNK